jgi:hypothetical protein
VRNVPSQPSTFMLDGAKNMLDTCKIFVDVSTIIVDESVETIDTCENILDELRRQTEFLNRKFRQLKWLVYYRFLMRGWLGSSLDTFRPDVNLNGKLENQLGLVGFRVSRSTQKAVRVRTGCIEKTCCQDNLHNIHSRKSICTSGLLPVSAN